MSLGARFPSFRVRVDFFHFLESPTRTCASPSMYVSHGVTYINYERYFERAQVLRTYPVQLKKNSKQLKSMHGSTAPAPVSLEWVSIALAVVLLVLGAAAQSAWTAWRSKIAEPHIDSTDAETASPERRRIAYRQCPARVRQGRVEPSSLLAVKKWISYAACHYPKHWEKTKHLTKTTTTVCDCFNPKIWTSYATNHCEKNLQTIHEVDGTHLPGLRHKSSASFERTLSSDVGVTEATGNLVRSRRKLFKPWHQDATPTDDVGSAGPQQRSSLTSLHSNVGFSFYSLDRERASSKPRRKEAKTGAKTQVHKRMELQSFVDRGSASLHYKSDSFQQAVAAFAARGSQDDVLVARRMQSVARPVHHFLESPI